MSEIGDRVKAHLQYVADSFASVLSFDIDPHLSEQDNVRKVIQQTGLVCAVVAVVNPLPLTDLIILAPLHTKMTFHIGRVKGFEVTNEGALEVLREVVSAVGMSMVGSALASFVKLIPVLGQFVFVPVVYGATWAIGCAVDAYFDGLRTGQIPTADEIKDLFNRELSRGKAEGAAIGRDQIDRAHEELKRRVHEREQKHGAPREDAPTGDATVTRVGVPKGDATPHKIRVSERPVRRPNEKTIGEPEEPAEKPEAKKKLDLGPATPAQGSEAPEASAPQAKTIGPATPAAGVEKAPAPAPPAKDPKTDLVETLERLAKLHAAGALTQEEFDAAKKKLLSS